MTESLSDKKPIVSLSRMSVKIDLPKGRRKKNESSSPARHRDYVVYGVDADGKEREYVRHETEEEHNRWEETDPLWREVQRAMINRLIDNPTTRGLVIELNAVATFEKGDVDTAARLIQCLSD